MSESKIILRNDGNGELEIDIKGNKLDLMRLLAELSNALKHNSNLTEENIKFAIELGLKNEEELKKETKKAIEQLPNKLKQLAELLEKL